MNAAHAIRRLEEAGFSHQQATGVVEVIQGDVIDHLATRDYVGEQTALVRQELAYRSARSARSSPNRSVPCGASWPRA